MLILTSKSLTHLFTLDNAVPNRGGYLSMKGFRNVEQQKHDFMDCLFYSQNSEAYMKDF